MEIKINKDWISKIGDHEKKVYSQSGQDGVLEFIFDQLGTKNNPPFCIEFGFNTDSLTGGSGSNTANFIINKGWKSLLLDSSCDNKKINLYKYYLTSSNICDIFKSYNVPLEPDYVSIDIDSTDLWLFKSVLSEYRPMVLSVEYNAHFPIDKAITLVDNLKDIENFCMVEEEKMKKRKKISQKVIRRSRERIRKIKRRTYGASLKALKIVGEHSGYSLVYVVKGLDAFFIKNDLIKGCNIPCLDSFKDKVAINQQKRQKNKSYINYFLDYETYIKTDGNIEKSIIKATPVCMEYIFKTIKEI